jgi:hypothetical protein
METINKIIETLKNLFAFLREAILVMLFCFVIFFPSRINAILIKAGFTNGDVMGFKWEKQLAETNKNLQAAGKVTSNAQDQIDKLQSTIDSITPHVKDQQTLNKISEAKSDLASFKTNVAMADKSVKTSMIYQQNMMNSVSPANLNNDYGWVYLGKADATKTKWIKTEHMTIAPTPLDKLTSTPEVAVALTDDVYLRKGGVDVESGFSNLPILTALKSGNGITVSKVKFVKAKDGNYFVWACTQNN